MALGTSAGTFQAKQLTRQGHSPTQEQTVCLKTPKFTPFPGHDCPPRGQGPGPTHPCAGTRPGTPRTLNTQTLGSSSSHHQQAADPEPPASATSKPAVAAGPASPTSRQAPVQERGSPAACGPSSHVSRPAPTLGPAGWALALSTSRPAQASRYPGPCSQLCQVPAPPTGSMTSALGPLGPTARLQDTSLPASRLAGSPGH